MFGRTAARLLITGFLLAAGCTTTRLPTANDATYRPAQPLEQWPLRARVSVTHGDKSWSGSLRWQHRASGDQLTLRDPIGRTRLRATSQRSAGSQTAQLDIAGQPTLTGSDLPTLLYSATRLHLPLEHLPNWITGHTSPELAAQIKRDPSPGRITEIVQAGWTIEYPDYQLENGIELPRKITLHDDLTQIRLVISHWQLTEN